MSFLTIAFGLGGLAIAFPLLFHLIRQSPRGRQEFSSLMFVEMSPPRLVKRSRVDEWLLLLLRAAVIMLLAIAFMRPFFRNEVLIDQSALPGRKVAILVDRSASMQRSGLWAQAVQKAAQALDKLRPQDDFAIYVFDESPKLLVDFNKDLRPTAEGSKKQIALKLLEHETPGWFATDFAKLFTQVIDEQVLHSDNVNVAENLQLILISDLQNSSVVDPLQSFEWPSSVQVDIRSVATSAEANANARLLKGSAGLMDEKPRVRVTNSGDIGREQFYVQWSKNSDAKPTPNAVPFLVPPGTSIVQEVPIPQESDGVDRLLVFGDEVNFDNVFFTVPVSKSTSHVFYFGDDNTNDAEGISYYLSRALADTALRQIKLHQFNPTDDWKNPLGEKPALIVVASPVSPNIAESLASLVESGSVLLATVNDQAIADSLKPLFGDVTLKSDLKVSSARNSDYRLLADLDFQHPILQQFAAPQFNDFTKIHFWQTVFLTINESDSKVIARFDNDAPAIWERPFGRGRAFGLSSSWRPKDSQLALSSKFVPLVNTIMEQAHGTSRAQTLLDIGEAWRFPDALVSKTFVTRPDGRRDSIDGGAGTYQNTDMPGIYRVDANGTTFEFAVNVSPAESDVALMPVERLKNLNVLVGNQPSIAQELSALQQLKDAEVEGRQKVWKWLIVAAIAFVIAETLLASFKQSKNVSFQEGAIPT